MTRREKIEGKAREIAAQIGGALDDSSMGFALLVFDFGKARNMTWISNAERASMIQALKELQERLEGGGADDRNLI